MLMSWPGLAVFTAFMAFTAFTAFTVFTGFAFFTFSTFAPLAFTSFVNFPSALLQSRALVEKNRQGMSEVVGAHGADHQRR